MISSASNSPLTVGTLPNVQGAMGDWFQPVIFTRIVKTIVDFDVVETPTSFSFQGVIQPFTAEKLAIKPEGQRSWKWFSIHAYPGLELNTDEIITIGTVSYRVMEKLDYAPYGYVEYHAVENYQ